ncbi:hypothetical protein PIB30_059320, partial [Stylosanthes scabra]|nr:hypothetical protein [Stylosanthes scabra]
MLPTCFESRESTINTPKDTRLAVSTLGFKIKRKGRYPLTYGATNPKRCTTPPKGYGSDTGWLVDISGEAAPTASLNSRNDSRVSTEK